MKKKNLWNDGILYNYPSDYLLFKDKTENLDDLEQTSDISWTAENGQVQETTPITEPVDKT